jgi:hypothetical protein
MIKKQLEMICLGSSEQVELGNSKQAEEEQIPEKVAGTLS